MPEEGRSDRIGCGLELDRRSEVGEYSLRKSLGCKMLERKIYSTTVQIKIFKQMPSIVLCPA
jgi:hypothetical protein